MVTVTRSEFDALNAKVDQVLEIVINIAREHDDDWQAFREFREETRQRFDELTAKVDALTQAHEGLRADFKRHDEDSR